MGYVRGFTVFLYSGYIRGYTSKAKSVLAKPYTVKESQNIYTVSNKVWYLITYFKRSPKTAKSMKRRHFCVYFTLFQFSSYDFEYSIAKFRLSNKKVTIIKTPQLPFFYRGKFVRQLRLWTCYYKKYYSRKLSVP